MHTVVKTNVKLKKLTRRSMLFSLDKITNTPFVMLPCALQTENIQLRDAGKVNATQ